MRNKNAMCHEGLYGFLLLPCLQIMVFFTDWGDEFFKKEND
jgi:hypothetical protein